MGIMFFYGILLGTAAGVFIGYVVFKQTTTNEDNSEKIQATIEKIDLIIQDIKKTV